MSTALKENVDLVASENTKNIKTDFISRIPRLTRDKSKLTQKVMSRHQKMPLSRGTVRSRSQDRARFAGSAETPPVRHTRFYSASANAGRPIRIERLSANSQKKGKVTFKKGYETSVIEAKLENPKITNAVPKNNRMAPTTKKTTIDSRIPYQSCSTPRHGNLDEQECNSSPSLTVDISRSLESLVSSSERIEPIQKSLTEKRIKFNKIKTELRKKQKQILELYAEMKSTQTRVLTMGGQANLLPASDELRIMNVAGLEPEQLLQLCIRHDGGENIGEVLSCASFTVMEKLKDLPTNLVSCCDNTLQKQKDIVDWINSLLTTKAKGIPMQELTNKVDEFTAENEDLTNSFNTVKLEFTNKVSEVLELLRKSHIDRTILKQRTVQLAVEVAELQTLNDELQSQSEIPKYVRADRTKIEELEKELKEEKCKRTITRERLSRSEQQLKTTSLRVVELESELEAARAQVRALEQAVHQLQEQNLRTQLQFDGDLKQLTESIKTNTQQIEVIAQAREKLETEKIELERRLEEAAQDYEMTIKSTRSELGVTIAQLLEMDRQRTEVLDKKKETEKELETVCTKLLEAELLNRDLGRRLEEKQGELESALELREDLKLTRRALKTCQTELEDFKQKVIEHEKEIEALERSKEQQQKMEESLRRELQEKQDSINDLREKLAELEEELQESETKLEQYETHIQQLKTHLGSPSGDDLESRLDGLTELHSLIMDQRYKLLETTRQNGELAEALQKKDADIEQSEKMIHSQDTIISRKEELIKMLSEKEAEQASVIESLQKNLEIRDQVDSDLNRQLDEKTEEVQNLLTNLDMRKQQIRQLEKIIMALEEQQQKISIMRKNDQDKITNLERTLLENKAIKKKMDAPHSLDYLINILEAELGKSENSELYGICQELERDYSKKSGSNPRDGNPVKHNSNESEEVDEPFSLSEIYSLIGKTSPTKILLDDFMQNSGCLTNKLERTENRDYNRYGTCGDSHGWMSGRQNHRNVYHTDIKMDGDVACGSGRDKSRRVKELNLSRGEQRSRLGKSYPYPSYLH